MAELERWLPISGYPFHEVSNLGQVRSINRVERVHGRWGGVIDRAVRGRILRPWPVGKGYLSVMLCLRGKKLYVHRLVASAFCHRPDGAGDVNHINGDKLDNKASNLEWVTKSENSIHASRVLGKRSGQFGPGRVRVA